MTKRCWIVSPGQAMIRRSLLGDRPFDDSIRGCDDWDLWLRIAERHPFLFQDRVALLYRLHDANASGDTLSMRRNDFRLLRKHLRRNVAHPDRLFRILYRFLALVRWTPATMIEQAERDISSGKQTKALAKLRYALGFRPHLWLDPRFRQLWRKSNHKATGT
jgi:hypothetical protein